MADWTPKVGDMRIVEQPYSGDLDVAGEIVIVTNLRHGGSYVDATIVRSGRELYEWARFRFGPLPNPKPKRTPDP